MEIIVIVILLICLLVTLIWAQCLRLDLQSAKEAKVLAESKLHLLPLLEAEDKLQFILALKHMPAAVLNDKIVYDKVWLKIFSFRNELLRLLEIQKEIQILPDETREKIEQLLISACETRDVKSWANDYLHSKVNRLKETPRIWGLIQSFQNKEYFRLVLEGIVYSAQMHSDLAYVQVAGVRHLLESLNEDDDDF